MSAPTETLNDIIKAGVDQLMFAYSDEERAQACDFVYEMVFDGGAPRKFKEEWVHLAVHEFLSQQEPPNEPHDSRGKPLEERV
jgi:hypothetical protein